MQCEFLVSVKFTASDLTLLGEKYNYEVHNTTPYIPHWFNFSYVYIFSPEFHFRAIQFRILSSE
jgi:hypothetical protein